MRSVIQLLLLFALEATRISNAFLTPSRKIVRAGELESSSLPTVEFTDPKTHCKVILLGCFHGTESSSQDVKEVVNEETDLVVLELCATRFADLRQAQPPPEKQRPWMLDYLDMISKTAEKRGLPTGLAFAILGGFSGLQTAISGFTPGLEFTTAMEESIKYECDIVLADQVVDETLRKIGSLPRISWDMNVPTNITNTFSEWNLHSTTIRRAVLGDEDIPRVELGKFLFRNSAAVQDLIRLTIPPILMFLLLVNIATFTVPAVDVDAVDISLFGQCTHMFASAGIMIGTFVGLVLPAIKVILTERDEILTKGIQAACEKAGEGGRVVAVLGLLHVNSIAKKMIEAAEKGENA